ncbi:MAG: glycosyltransferase family 2 protein [Oscillospiraceae bacterium]|nr:glycosyltransferase family 2 protein [Oscillospiraceae bacterium]
MNVIVMSTYNGGQYLRDQLDSVLRQTVADFTLLIRDDGSSDNTVQIIQSYTDPRIRLIAGENLGPSGSFFALLDEARHLGATYVFFCDQDDIWLENKLELLLAEIRDISGPALVFSDFSMIDGQGELTGDSYAAMAGLRIPADGNFFPKLLAQPYIFGCASVLNGELLELIKSPPAGIEMYDCWIGLVASLFGTVQYLPVSTIQHRFHSSNATGQAGMNALSTRLRRITKEFRKQRDNTRLRLQQADLLLDRYGMDIPAAYRRQLSDIATAGRKGGFRAVRTLKKYTVARGGRLQNLFFYATAFMCKGDK